MYVENLYHGTTISEHNFNALQYDQAVEYAVRKAIERGNERSISIIRNSDRITV